MKAMRGNGVTLLGQLLGALLVAALLGAASLACAEPAGDKPASGRTYIGLRPPRAEEPASDEPAGNEPGAAVEPATRTEAEGEPEQEPEAGEQPQPAEAPAEAPTGRAILEKAYAATTQARSEEDYTAILDLCQQALDMEPDDAQQAYANSLMAWTFNRRGETRSAAGAKARPGSPEQNQAEEQALADFEEAVALDSNRWKAVYNRGVSYANAGRLDDALADFNRTIALKPDFVRAHFNRAEVRFALGDVQASLEDYDETIRLAPDHAEAFTCRGFARYSLGEVQAAIEDFNQAVQLDPQNTTALVDRGDAYGDQGDFARATQDYRRALEIDPRFARAYLSWGWLMATCPEERFRSSRMALEYAQAAVRLFGEEHYRYLAVLAAAHANAGEFDKAEEIQARAMTLAPEDDKPAEEKRLGLYTSNQPFRDIKEQEQAANP